MFNQLLYVFCYRVQEFKNELRTCSFSTYCIVGLAAKCTEQSTIAHVAGRAIYLRVWEFKNERRACSFLNSHTLRCISVVFHAKKHTKHLYACVSLFSNLRASRLSAFPVGAGCPDSSECHQTSILLPERFYMVWRPYIASSAPAGQVSLEVLI